MPAIQFQDTNGMVNDPSNGVEHLTTDGVYNEQAAAVVARSLIVRRAAQDASLH